MAAGNLITPLEPGLPARLLRGAAQPGVAARQSVHSNAFRRIDVAVATSCGYARRLPPISR